MTYNLLVMDSGYKASPDPSFVATKQSESEVNSKRTSEEGVESFPTMISVYASNSEDEEVSDDKRNLIPDPEPNTNSATEGPLLATRYGSIQTPDMRESTSSVTSTYDGKLIFVSL